MENREEKIALGKKALELQAEGVSWREIAKRLNTSVSNIRRYARLSQPDEGLEEPEPLSAEDEKNLEVIICYMQGVVPPQRLQRDPSLRLGILKGKAEKYRLRMKRENVPWTEFEGFARIQVARERERERARASA